MWGREDAPLHEKTRKILELLLLILDKYGEEEMVDFINRKVIPYEKSWDHPEKWKRAAAYYEKKYQVDIFAGEHNHKKPHTI
jgi:hypothetical protein